MYNLNLRNYILLRDGIYNTLDVEKAFIYPYGLPGRAQDRHVAFNFGFHNIRPSKATFPGITEALHMAKKKGDWDLVKQQVSIATYCVQSATKVLEPLAGQ